MYGKMTTSRMGIIGSFLDSNFSLDVVTASPWDEGLPGKLSPFYLVREAFGMALTVHFVGILQCCHRRRTGVSAPHNLSGLFHDGGEGSAALLHHLAGHFELFYFLLARQVEHQVEHELFEDHAQAPGSHFAGHSLARNGAEGFVVELQAHVL